jgi:hypothetical protein
MLAQPQGALYVIMGARGYYIDLAKKHGREDLTIVSWVELVTAYHRWIGVRLSAVYLDHSIAECLTDDNYGRIYRVIELMRPFLGAPSER